MSSQSITRTPDSGVVLGQIGAALSKLKAAERFADDKIKQVERALRKLDPGVEVWTPAVVQEQGIQCPGLGEPGQQVSRTVSLGFARVDLMPGLKGWARALPWSKVGKVWGLALREEYRAEGAGQPRLRQDMTLLRKASRELRMLAAPHLDQLLGLIHDELRAHVDHLPPELSPPVTQDQARPSDEPNQEQKAAAAGAEPAPA